MQVVHKNASILAAALGAFSGAVEHAIESFDGLRRGLRIGRPGEGKARRAAYKASIAVYKDRVGMWHGGSGDKLARKAAQGCVGLRGRRSPLQAWASRRAAWRASLPRSKRGLA